jgi:hypothetical protein
MFLFNLINIQRQIIFNCYSEKNLEMLKPNELDFSKKKVCHFSLRIAPL